MLKEKSRKSTLLVKHVTLLHYLRLMEEMGAMAYYSTTVHERKNGWMKNITRRNRNFRFLFKSFLKYIETTEIAEEVAKAYRDVRTMPRRRKACLQSDTKEVLEASCLVPQTSTKSRTMWGTWWLATGNWTISASRRSKLRNWHHTSHTIPSS